MANTGPSPYDLVRWGSYIRCSDAEEGTNDVAPAALRAALGSGEVSRLRSRRFTVAMRTLLFPAKGRRASRQTPHAAIRRVPPVPSWTEVFYSAGGPA